MSRARTLLVCVVFLSLAVACSSPALTTKPDAGPPAAARLGNTWTRPVDGKAMVYVPAGEFIMGNADGEPDERPPHTVILDGFWIDQTEVANAEYEKCVKAGACQAPTSCDWGKPTYGDASTADHPVVCVDWHDAHAYCVWAGARLPSEAEWEYAARGPQGFTYPWGNEFDCSRGNFDDETWIHRYVVPGGQGCDGFLKSAPIGSFEAGASWCGALDMAGNVSEWVSDWYSRYSPAPQTNPTGPPTGDFKVLRGSAWVTFQGGERSTVRHRDIPDSRNRDGGFRCAVSPVTPPP